MWRGQHLDPRAEQDLLDLFGLLGELVPVDEHLMEAATALSGCGPAFFALVVEALTDAGVREGLPAPTAERLAVATMLGTAELLARARQPGRRAARGDLARRSDRRGRRGARAGRRARCIRQRRAGGRGEGRGGRGRLEVSAVVLVFALEPLRYRELRQRALPRLPDHPVRQDPAELDTAPPVQPGAAIGRRTSSTR